MNNQNEQMPAPLPYIDMTGGGFILTDEELAKLTWNEAGTYYHIKTPINQYYTPNE